MNSVITKNYGEPTFSKKEILRYAGVKLDTGEYDTLLNSVLLEAEDKFIYKVCYMELDVRVDDGVCDFGFFKINSHDLAKTLSGFETAILFAATVGVGIDRLIAKNSRTSPSKALLFQALGTERIEALSDLLCEDLKKEYGGEISPRFSVGYGDAPLHYQKEIIALLDAGRKIGISLNESMLMSPTKSVTAFVGIKK